MSIKDFKTEVDLQIDDITIILSSASTSGGLYYTNSNKTFSTSKTNIPIGTVRLWASGSTSPTVPDDYLICDGRQNLNTTTYASLYNVIGDRFTASPNGNTFGLPSFNSVSLQYPVVIGIDKSKDVATGGVYAQTANENTILIGSQETTAHTHTSSAGYTFNATSNSTIAHTHNAISSSDVHAHGFGTSTTNSTSHNHNSGNASLNHSHNHQPGDVALTQTGAASGNHTHTYGTEDSNHSHNSSNDGHTHGTNTPSGLTSNVHKHSITTTLASNTTTHSHILDVSGFYFIIRYQ